MLAVLDTVADVATLAVAPTYDAMTIDQLQAELVDLASQLVTVNEKRRVVLTLMDQRKANAEASARVAGMSLMQRDALKAALA